MKLALLLTLLFAAGSAQAYINELKDDAPVECSISADKILDIKYFDTSKGLYVEPKQVDELNKFREVASFDLPDSYYGTLTLKLLGEYISNIKFLDTEQRPSRILRAKVTSFYYSSRVNKGENVDKGVFSIKTEDNEAAVTLKRYLGEYKNESYRISCKTDLGEQLIYLINASEDKVGAIAVQETLVEEAVAEQE